MSDPTTKRYTSRRTPEDVLRDLREALDKAQERDDFPRLPLVHNELLAPLINELVEMAEPRVTIPLGLADEIARLLISIGEGMDVQHNIQDEQRVRDLGHNLRDLILTQR